MILTVTLNPALDKILFVDKLVKNKNNRVNQLVLDIGGKATHVSVALSALGVGNTATGILAGNNGKNVERLLQNKGVNCDFVWQEGQETRESYIVVQANKLGSYMITNKGFDVTEDMREKVIDKIDKTITGNDTVVFSGGLPKNFSPRDYLEIVEKASCKKAKVIIDCSGDSFKEAVKLKPYLIKPNEDEFAELIGYKPKNEMDYILAVKDLNSLGVEIVALSLGKKGCLVSTNDHTFRVVPPKVEEVNDVGCGDIFLGTAIAMLEKGKNLEESFRFATAYSASKATHQDSSSFSIEQGNKFYNMTELYYL